MRKIILFAFLVPAILSQTCPRIYFPNKECKAEDLSRDLVTVGAPLTPMQLLNRWKNSFMTRFYEEIIKRQMLMPFNSKIKRISAPKEYKMPKGAFSTGQIQLDKQNMGYEPLDPMAEHAYIDEAVNQAQIPHPSTLKDSKKRFNYASFDCAAIVLSTNSDAIETSAILVENKDRYMLNICSAKKFVIIELCEELLIDTIMIGNFEFFSSMFKDIRISATDKYPPKSMVDWKSLGLFRAQNARDMQVFEIKDPVLWARYLRIDFLSHYGNEYYCPVSIVKVFGTTMMEDLRNEQDGSKVKQPAVHSRDYPYSRLNGYGKRARIKANKSPYETFLAMDTSLPKLNEKDEIIFPQLPKTDEKLRLQPSNTQRSSSGAQDSVLKAIIKRLAILEQNMTMSQEYLVEQRNALILQFKEHQDGLNLLRQGFEQPAKIIHMQQEVLKRMEYQQTKFIEKIHLISDALLFEKRLGFVQLIVLLVTCFMLFFITIKILTDI